ncbi:MAG: GldG family protein [Methylovulum sp.]|nr:GldG family protein [Methylovulum sp.]
MKLSQRLHQQIALKNTLATLALLCLIAVLAWLSARYPLQIDITRNASNTLSPASQKLLDSLPDKVHITAYIKKSQPLRVQIAQLIDRYSRHKPDVSLSFIDPDSQPEKTRELAIGAEGLVLVEYQGRTEKLQFVDESTLTNALLHLANAKQRWVTFLTGHGERAPDGIANFDLGQFGKELARRKITALTLNLATVSAIPDNSALLVIAAPAVPLLAGEIDLIKHYIQRGGNLLLLTDPDNKNLDALQQQLGIRKLPGIIVDSGAGLYGIDDPSFVLATAYPPHPVTRGLQIITLYPVAAALEHDKASGFNAQPLLNSSSKTWTETGAIAGAVGFNANSNEKQGPLTFAYALTRTLDNTTEQRVIVIGDSDFLANTYLGNVGNLDMGLRLINWLIHDDQYIDIPAKIAIDKSLQLTQTTVALVGFGFLIIIPLLLIGTGFIIWRNRKRR